MKTTMLKSGILVVTLAVLAWALAACRTAEEPNYQGRSGSAPKVTDYYPSKTNNVIQPK